MISILRDIKKIIINATVAIKFVTFKIGDKSIESDSKILFPDGFISINSKSKALIQNIQETNYSFFVNDSYEIIKEYSLVDSDVFIGRIGNYILFSGGNFSLNSANINLSSTNINLNCTNLNITCDDINITVANNITINGIALSFSGGKVSIAGNEVAVVGGATQTCGNIVSSVQ